MKSKLTVVHGPMFSGKTSWLIKEYGDGKGVLAFKPDIDKRYTLKPVLRSHDDKEVPAVLLSLQDLSNLLNEAVRGKSRNRLTKILIDEINFFPAEVMEIIKQVLALGINVSAAGLLTDSDRQDFGPTRQLVVMADEVKEFQARCDVVGCKIPAIYTYAKKKKETQVVVGAADMYGAVCERHYDELAERVRQDLSGIGRLAKYGVYPGYIDWLNKMEMPYVRQNRKITTRIQPHIEVGGDNMRVGKTTALTVLQETLQKHGFTLQATLEDWRHNPYVAESYGDSSEIILKSQKWFAKRKYEQLSKVDPSKAHIQDVNPEMDFGYALCNAVMGRMTLKQFESYVRHYYDLDWESIPAPDLLVYLTCSDEALIARAKKSAREFETIDETYFLIMKVINRKWLEGAKKKYRVIEVDTDDFDFATEEEAKEKLAELVIDKLKKIGWRPSTNGSSQKSLFSGFEEVIGELARYDGVLMAGMPGSGKSFLAGKLKREHGFLLLSSDEEREKLSGQERFGLAGDEVNQRYSERAYEIVYQKAFENLSQGKRVVVDASNLKRSFANYLKNLHGVSKNIVVCVVKSDGETVAYRMKKKRGRANDEESYYEGWKRVNGYFRDNLARGNYVWPDEKNVKVRVVEVWND